jgi:predicted  nucleic acid-binding Zn-ribbon protein
MNQPTRQEFEQLKEQVKRLEQQTEPINVRIERGLPIPEATLLQTIMDMVGRQGPDIGQLKVSMERTRADTNILKTDMEGVKADIKSIRATQSDHGERFKEHGDRLIRIEARLETMATREDIAAVKNDVGRLEKIMLQILDRMPQPEGE